MKTSPYIALSLLLVFRAVGSYAQGDADPDWQSNQRTDDPPALGSSWVPQQMPPPPPGPVPKSPGQPSIAEANTPQIQALAQGLQNDPTRIFNFVHNYINYVLYFGSKKGAQLTLLEKSGNDFDQCALMVALLRAAGYSDAAYQFGWMQVPYDNPDGSGNDLHHWLNLSLVNTNWQNTSNYLYTLFCKCRGYPTYYFWANDTNDFCFQRVWVTFSAGGTNYCVDPAFKTAQPTNGINLASAMGFTSNVLMGAVGGTDTSRYVSGLTESALRAQMTTYTTNLLYFIRTNCPTDSVLQILGGNEPLISPQAPLANGLLFSAFQWTNAGVAEMPIVSWVNLPTNLMSTLQITFAGNVGYQWYVPQLCGDRLALTFDSAGNAQLWQEDNLLAQGSTGGAATTAVTLYINHPYGNWNLLTNGLIDTTFNDQTVTSIYQGTNATYAIIYAFEPDWGWFQQRQDQLDAYRAQGLPDTSRQVVSETLNVMGLNWLLETAWAGHIMDPQLHVLPQFHHRIGRMGQETGHGYYVDAYMQSAGRRRHSRHPAPSRRPVPGPCPRLAGESAGRDLRGRGRGGDRRPQRACPGRARGAAGRADRRPGRRFARGPDELQRRGSGARRRPQLNPAHRRRRPRDGLDPDRPRGGRSRADADRGGGIRRAGARRACRRDRRPRRPRPRRDPALRPAPSRRPAGASPRVARGRGDRRGTAPAPRPRGGDADRADACRRRSAGAAGGRTGSAARPPFPARASCGPARARAGAHRTSGPARPDSHRTDAPGGGRRRPGVRARGGAID